MKLVLMPLKNTGVVLKLKKYPFITDQIDYLRHTIKRPWCEVGNHTTEVMCNQNKPVIDI